MIHLSKTNFDDMPAQSVDLTHQTSCNQLDKDALMKSDNNAFQKNSSPIHPVSTAQREMWLAQRFSPDRSFSTAEYVEIDGPFDEEIFSKAITLTIEQTPALQAQFAFVNEQLIQSFGMPVHDVLSIVDLCTSDEPLSDAHHWMQQDLAQPHQPEAGDLFAFVLFRLKPDRFIWYQRYHHTIIDGRSQAIIARRIAQIYAALIHEQPIPKFETLEFDLLVQHDSEYRDSAQFLADKTFWQNYLDRDNQPAWLSLPPALRTNRKKSRAIATIADENIRHLKHTAQTMGVSQSHLLIAALGVHFHLLTGQTQLNFSLPVANRSKNEIGVPGMTSNVLPLILQVKTSSRLSDVVLSITHELNRILPHQRYRMEEMQRDERMGRTRCFGPAINLMNFNHGLPFKECQWRWFRPSNDVAPGFNVTFYQPGDGQGLQIFFEADTALHMLAELQAHLQLFLSILEKFIHTPDHTVETIATEYSNQYDNSLHECVFAQRREPDAAGCLRWHHPAHNLAALVRALDFGHAIANPLGLPKILLKNRFVCAMRLDILGQRSGAAPGTLLRIGQKFWEVASGSEDVCISHFARLTGELLDAREIARQEGLSEGDCLPSITEDQANSLLEMHQLARDHDSFWSSRLARFNPLHFPFTRHSNTPEAPSWQLGPWHMPEAFNHLAPEECRRYLIGILCVYLARITRETQFQLGWALESLDLSSRQLPNFLAHTVPMEVSIDPEMDFAEICQNIESEIAGLEEHRTFALDLVMRHPELSAIDNLHASHPWSVAVKIWHDGRDDAYLEDDVHGQLVTFQINAQDGCFRWHYDAARLSSDQIDRMTGHLLELAQAATTSSMACTPMGQLNLLPESERTLLLKTWNETQADYPADLCIHQLFEQQVERTPQAIALVYEDQTLTYAELNAQANQLAHQLIELGVEPDARVAICVERSLAMVVGVLAILKAGAAYVPLDPAYPGERLAHILADADPSIVLADASGRAALGEAALASCQVLDPNTLPQQSDINPSISALTSRHLAYVIYTSGSTGTPKGVMVEHRGLVNLAQAQIARFDVRADSRILQFASFSFDASSWEIVMALGSGANLYFPSDLVRQDRSQLWAYLQQHAITHATLPPALLQGEADVFLPNQADQALTLILAGEAPNPVLLRSLARLNTIFNAYGPTEITVCATTWHCPVAYTGETIPIGQPIANTRIYLLDRHGQPVPLGVAGELYIGGDGVARGYLNRPELTAERFLDDPYASLPGARMYRTGDLARYLPDGNLEFLGRNDHQLKIRGFRIEPGEIEARLTGHPAVREACVLAWGEDADKRLVAYVVAKADAQLATTLREFLSHHLPDYMVPAAFVCLDAFPLTPNGKLDRRALPAPDGDAYAHRAYEAPQGPIEIAIADIWSELLGVERISRHDSFFELGGHSLLAVRLINRAATLGADLSLATLFASPVLRDLAQTIEARLKDGAIVLPPISPVSRDTVLPLSFAQQRLWFLSQLDGVSQTYHIPLALHLRGALDANAWQHALNILFARHEALRSVFVTLDGQPEVRLLDPDTPLPLQRHDLRAVPDAQETLTQLKVEEARAPFDLVHGPLIRARLIQLDEDQHVFLLTQHHIVSDGWSLGVMLSELSALYRAALTGQAHSLPALAIQYPDYAAWQRQWLSGERLQAHSDYWRTTLTDTPVRIDLPTDRPRPAQQSFAGAHVPIQLDAQLTQSLKHLSQAHGVTLFMTVLAAWAAVLSRLSGQDDLVIGTPSANRGRKEVEPLIGFFVNTLALRLDLSQGPNTAQLLERVRQTTLGAQDHQDLPFEQIVEIVNPPRHLDHTPLFQVMFAWQNNEAGNWQLPGLEVSPVHGGYEVAKFDLTLSLAEHGDEIAGSLNYATALFDRDTIERQVGYLQAMLRAMVAEAIHHEWPVASLDILPPAERQLLLKTWNETQADYPADQCMHQLFEQQVERTPQAIALVYEDQTLTYAELNARANRLAHQLIELGVELDARVAICVERSLAMVVGVLAILKAGAAYVPLDPAYPGERLAHILADANPSIVLADANCRATLGDTALASRQVIDPNTLPQQPDINPRISALTSRHLAYVIYTSGSTGTPKGVMVEHRGLVNLAQDQIARFDVRADSRILQFASFSFDASSWEIVMALGRGASLYFPSDLVRQDRSQLWTYLQQHAITHALLPPALLQGGTNVFQPNQAEPTLTLILGGEAPNPALLRSLARLNTIFNAYGPTEITVCATTWNCPVAYTGETIPIGQPIANTRIYLLDCHGQPVPLGVAGELYIGGAGVARGYLNRPELTAERFLDDPYADLPGARMYRTGDLARYLPDGNLEFLGRNDHQLKIRGFRIEPGEIEARLTGHPAVREACVLAWGEDTGKRLVAYVVAEPDAQLATTLREFLSQRLPDYMVPAAFVRLDAFPLTPNGKLDRRALPAPDGDAYAHRAYEAPQGPIETAIADIWTELLGVERISRHDSFFELGGHSLLAVRLIEHLRRVGLSLAIRDLFQSPTLCVLAQTLGQHREVSVPPNLITADTATLTPDLLPLIDLSQSEIDHIVAQVPGGLANLQDIYALSPLQDGILFHHLLATDGDPYLLISQMAFADRATLDHYLDALQQVVDRHDILRTAFVWQGLSNPAQVVWRHAPLSITELHFDPANGPIREQLTQRFDPRQHRIDLSQAPLIRFVCAQDIDGRWLLLQLLHHLIGDHTTLEVMHAEVRTFLAGQGEDLPAPQPFRNLVAQTRLGVSQAEHERFFTTLLAEVDEPTLPFGLAEVHRDGAQVEQAHRLLARSLNDRLRAQARRLGVSLASLCHLAWAQVLSRTSGQERVVFGTVLFGRMQAGDGADRAMGLFINTLPVRLDLDQTGVEASVRATHARLADLLAHEHASLALAQRCSGVPAGTPLFSALLNYRHNAMPAGKANPLSDIEFLGAQERTNYPITLSVEDFGQALGLTVQLVQPLDPERVCSYMEQALISLAEALEQAPERPVASLEILPPAERQLLLKTWNETQADYPADLCIHQLFEQQVERTPQAIALVYEDQTLTYAELNAQANQLAHQLIELGVEPDARVAICVERSLAMVVGVLAILKAGAAYVPLDPAYPGERLAHILADADPSIVLADASGRAALGEAALASCQVLDPNTLPQQSDINPSISALTSRHLAYVIYTSGSTGTPKGVMVEHRGLVNLAQAQIARFDVRADSRILQFASFSFDASSWEIVMALGSGANLYFPSDLVRQDRSQLWAYLQQHAITHATLPPALLQGEADVFLPNQADQALTLILAGEAPNPVLLRSLARLNTIFNAYGPTEITVCATTWHCPVAYTGETIPIGQPIANTRIYLLDRHGQPVPLGVAGELYIGGDGVARGYLNRPELTAERFLDDPYASLPGARMYRTGDLARYLPDGNLEFLGRNDHQLKIRGFRIEPGEIEARLTGHPAVREACVLAWGEDADKRLVAYVVAKADAQLATTLREFLSHHLPDYMVPAAFVCLDAFPLTPNGKLDRRALPAPDGDAYAHRAYEAPQGPIEIAIADIWSELLGLERISRHDAFFELGGHSLLAVRLIEHLRRVGLSLAIRDLFQSPTLCVLAQTLGQHREVSVPPNLITADTATLTPDLLPLIDLSQSEIDHIVAQVPGGLANLQDIYALSPLQDGILFHHLLATDGDPYLLISQMAFADRATLDHYLDALQQVVDRHDILRTAFVWQGLSNPAQVVWRHAPLSITELHFDPANGPIREQLTQRFDPRQHRIDLSQAPLIRFVCAQDIDGRWLLLQLLHHLIGDHTTLEVMHAEVRTFLAGQGEDLPAPQPFRNLVAQTRLGVSQAEHERFFTTLLAEVDEPTLPFGLAEVHRDGAQVEQAHRLLARSLNDRLRAQARRLGVSLASLCHLAWAQVLSRTSGQERVVFGTVLFGRMQAGDGADRAMGLFINTLPVRLDLDQTGVEASVRATHARLADLLAHEHASLALVQRCSRVPAGAPLFSALLNYRHNAMPTGEASAPSGIEFLGGQERTNYPITLSVEDYDQALGLTAQLVAPLDPDRVCAYMEQALISLAEALEQTPEHPVASLDILPQAERQLLLKTWNETQADYPADQCMHQLFEQQVERTPQAIALVYEDQTLTYAALNARANQLAHQLIELGVEPDARVAICVERSLAMVVGLLAILKAGAAYVPLDPAYPGERLAQILADADPSIVFADASGRTSLGKVALVSRQVLDPNTLPQQLNTNPQVPDLTSRHLAYVIYTSGSTGTPKGVMVEHRGLVNLAQAQIVRFDVRANSRILQFVSFSFDVSSSDIAMALGSGASLYLPSDLVRQDRSQLWAYLQQHAITHAALPPSLLQGGTKEFWRNQANQALTLMIGGEAPNPALLRSLARLNTIFNAYGPTEITVCATTWNCPVAYTGETIPIGQPIANTRIYLLDCHGQPVPLGVAGELYIGGAGVARGYLNRPELTAERFLDDPYADLPGARMYRTGDLARYLPDGNLEFLGRNDHQLKIRGFRIEPGEIEARLTGHPAVREACVLAWGEDTGKRLVAYVVAEPDAQLATTLREFLSQRLPDYMVPAAFVRLDAFPLTPNGKLDRRALPAPDGDAYAHRAYEAPQGPIETAIADIWTELLGVERISRHDSFFELGGHSLLAVRLIEHLRRVGLSLAIRDLFQSPTLSVLAQTLGQHTEVSVPPNLITADTATLTPDLLPLIDLSQSEIDHIVAQVPGGLANLQDIYALSPLQDGILFHHLLATDGDPYLLIGQMAFADRTTLDRYLNAIQQVVVRHDILRTAFVWQGLSNPAQVVWRQAPLSVTELSLDPAHGPIREQLAQRFDPRQHRIDLSQAPLIRFTFAQDLDGRWLLQQLLHHLIGDHSTLEVMHAEVRAFLAGQGEHLPAPQPFRNLVAQTRLGVSQAEHERFFTTLLAEVDEPTLPFGLAEVHRDGAQVEQAHRLLARSLNDRLRAQARRLGVSLASLCHLAWAQVLSRTSGQERVVFGTVLFGRMQAGDGADRAMGLFINTLPLRLNLDQTGVEASVRATHARLADLLAHEHASLALAQRCSRVPAGTPLFSALLNYRHNAMPTGEASAPSGIEFLGGQERTNYPITLSVEDYDQALGLTAQLVAPLDPDRVCAYMEQALISLAEALEQTPEHPVASLDILPPAERQLLLKTWNETQADYPTDQCMHQLFEQQVERTPQAIALVYEDQTLTYAELNARANQLAHQLMTLGVESGCYVATLLERSIELVVAQLAILKAGAAYVPIDPQAPEERQTWILADCDAQVLITDTHASIPATPLTSVSLLRLAPESRNSAEVPPVNPDLRGNSLDPAYVMYTSGSTGTPKGVIVPHQAVSRLVINNGYADIGTDDRVAFAANPAFDASTFEVWAPLLNGATLVVIDHETVLSTKQFAQILRRERINILWLTAGLFNQTLTTELELLFPQFKLLIVGGDVLDPALISQVLLKSPPQRLLNGYGPTESTTFATTCDIAQFKQPLHRVPIGRPIANTRIYLLDQYGQPVPLGVAGELYIGGAGVARGYLNRPELTAERFLDDPYADLPGARMYRTGDLARYLPDGNLEFLGRNDHQLKIRGFRIEPGEIEARLTGHPAVREACVLAWGEDTGKRLVAYVVAEPDAQLATTLREFLSQRLPDYMVPAAFVRLDAFPLTPNGKLDRRALPAPDGDAYAHRAYEAPQGPIETAIADIWTELLGVERISRHDSFFELGGHSLLAVRLIEHLRRVGLSLAIRDLFQSPTLSVLAQTLGQHTEVSVPPNLITADTATLTPDLLPLIDLSQSEIDHIVAQVPGGLANLQDIYALSPLQDGILFHHLLATDGDPYLLIGQMAFADRTTLDRYLNAIQQVVVRHDILRTAFVWQGLSNPAQVVWRQAPLSVTELSLDPAHGPIREQLAQRFDPRQHRIDLSQAPLIRFTFAQDLDGRWLLQQLLHHLIGDHSTLEVMHAEVRAFLAGQGEHLPAPQPFRNLVAQTRLGVSQAEHERFFTTLLAEVDEPTLPFGLAEVHRDGAQVEQAHRLLARSLNDRLRAQARRLGVSLASLCHLAWAQVLSRTSGQERVVFGTVLFGRMQAGDGADRAMGLFINTLPLRLNLDQTGVEASVRATHARLADLLAHEHASLALAQRCSRVPAGTPLFSALLNYRHNAMPTGEASAPSGIEFLGGQERTNYPITLSVEDYDQALGLTAQLVAPLDPDRVCAYMEQALISLAEALEQTPEHPVASLDILPPAERQLLLKTWNETQADYPTDQCMHQLFEQQVERTPQAIALVYEDQTLTYAELNARANQLAHQLIELGVEPDARVAICVERSLAMVVGLLAILKAGAAYVPLDPAYPGERLAHILADADPSIVFADASGRTTLGEAALASRQVLDPDTLPQQLNTNPQVPALTSRHLAYVIYTSGSTGIPKGVMVEHRSLLNLNQALNQTIFAQNQSATVGLNSSLAFDASLQNLLSLLRGGKLVIVARDVRVDGTTLFHLIQHNALDVLDCTPTQLDMLLSAGLLTHPSPMTLLVGGEPIAESVWQTLASASQLTVYNVYGPTECTVDATCARLDLTQTRPTIGRPIANTRIYLLDRHGQPVPLGVAGELYIGGDGVARGYLNRPELTAERFLDDPYASLPGARMYRTGDLARYLPDGNLEFLGRNDHQLKIRGFRIEPGEIEARLTGHPAVREACVLAWGEDADKRLVAYVVAKADAQLATTLREFLSHHLPDYMVPAAFVCLDAFPLTPNGKLDRRALPAPDGDAYAHRAYEAPQGPIETVLAGIWSELLGLERISRHDSFFELGGHSLLAIRMVSTALNCDIKITMNDLFQYPLLSHLAMHISSKTQRHDDTLAIPVRRTGTQVPLFFVPTGLGDHSYVFELAQEIDDDYPIYALPWQSVDHAPLQTLEAMASRMVAMMLKIQPHGPYRLAGYSSGGVLAYAIAQQLLGLDQAISSLYLVDVLHPALLPSASLSVKQKLFNHIRGQYKHTGDMTTVLTALHQQAEDLTLEELIVELQRAGALSETLDVQHEIWRWEQRHHYDLALHAYQITKLPITVHQFYASEPMEHDGAIEHYLPSRGWEKILPIESIRSIPIPGNHATMVEDTAHRATLGSSISAALRENSGVVQSRVTH